MHIPRRSDLVRYWFTDNCPLYNYPRLEKYGPASLKKDTSFVIDRHAPQAICLERQNNLPLIPSRLLSRRNLIHFKVLGPGLRLGTGH